LLDHAQVVELCEQQIKVLHDLIPFGVLFLRVMRHGVQQNLRLFGRLGMLWRCRDDDLIVGTKSSSTRSRFEQSHPESERRTVSAAWE
jgi:hypothetical protein